MYIICNRYNVFEDLNLYAVNNASHLDKKQFACGPAILLGRHNNNHSQLWIGHPFLLWATFL
jgi:hypothetical protein